MLYCKPLVYIALLILPNASAHLAASAHFHVCEPGEVSGATGLDGDGSITISGELKVWHNVVLTLDGPFARETDRQSNPFLDYQMTVRFSHEDGTGFSVPGYFAADGKAADSSATSGTKWRAHLAPNKPGKWHYRVEFLSGRRIAVDPNASASPVIFTRPQTGSFEVKASDKSGRDLRGKGRLTYVGKRYLQFAGDKSFFLKAGADAPETLLGYKDFDGTVARKKNVPLKSYQAHVQDWKEGDPTWKNNKGKGLIGAVNYLSGKGCNAFSFLTYNAGGDGDNVWPYIERDKKFNFDCSKLDQWGIVFQHGTRKGMYLHFKLQETENDDNRRGKKAGRVKESLDGGSLGDERRLYLRELVARFSHNLALNWNLGEENTQSNKDQKAMAAYIREIDPYDHLIVVHTFPGEQDKVYRPLLGDRSVLRGASLQNSHIRDTHWQTVKWVKAAETSGTPWVIAFDESGSAAHGQCPDLGYRGFDGKDNTGKYIYTQHDVRRQTLWGTLMGGGAGVEYYFGYQFAENDLRCEDWRSRDQSWDYCRIAIQFFQANQIPFWETSNHDRLIGNKDHKGANYCLAKPGKVYVVYFSKKETIQLDVVGFNGGYTLSWFNPQTGDQSREVSLVAKGSSLKLTPPESFKADDVVALLKKK